MKILVWQWGRRGAGPRFATCLADALRGRPGIEVALSLSQYAEIMTGADAPRCEMPVRTYRGPIAGLARLLAAPLALPFPWRCGCASSGRTWRSAPCRHCWTC